jgi:hypothetical protein
MQGEHPPDPFFLGEFFLTFLWAYVWGCPGGGGGGIRYLSPQERSVIKTDDFGNAVI